MDEDTDFDYQPSWKKGAGLRGNDPAKPAATPDPSSGPSPQFPLFPLEPLDQGGLNQPDAGPPGADGANGSKGSTGSRGSRGSMGSRGSKGSNFVPGGVTDTFLTNDGRTASVVNGLIMSIA